MVIQIIRRKGIDDAEVVARWHPERGFVSGDLPFTEDPVYDDYDADMMFEEFDGPDYFAVEEPDQKTFRGAQG